MNKNSEFEYLTISDLSRDEKREIWMRRTGHNVSRLASVVGLSANLLSRYLRAKSMPAVHHAALVDYGVPAEVLPAPEYRAPGRKPTVPVENWRSLS